MRPQQYDIIGDVHGFASLLKKLLKTMDTQRAMASGNIQNGQPFSLAILLTGAPRSGKPFRSSGK